MIVGTAGHIDHGKTALVRALTGTDTDRLAAEKARGITIELGFAYTDLGDGTVTGFVDVPGHEKLVHTMVAGAGGIDLALLVVAASEGVMPQTREHAAILRLLGVGRALVALSKADLADDARRAAVTAQVAALWPGAEVVPVSTVTGEGIDALRAALRAEAAALAPRAGGRLRVIVDRSFTLAGAGTVVTGLVASGRVAEGEEVALSPSGLRARVRGLRVQGRAAAEAGAGARVALNLAGVAKDAAHRGDVVLPPADHAPTDRVDVALDWIAPRPLVSGLRARLHVGAAEAGARVVVLAEGLAQLVLDRPLAVTWGQRFILRDVGARETLAGGSLLDLRPPARRRAVPERLAALRAEGTDLRARLAEAPGVADLAVWLRDRALDAADLEGVTLLAGQAVRDATAAALRAQVGDTLAAWHAAHPEQQGLARERLRLGLTPRLPRPAFDALLDGLPVRREGGFVRLATHEARLTDADAALWARAAPELGGDARFRPPRVRDLATAWGVDERELRRVLKLVARQGRVDQVATDHFFLRATMAEMVAIVAELSAGGWFAAAAFRDRVQNGRKVAIEILEFLDRAGVTLRRGDLRRINPHRVDLFGPHEGPAGLPAAPDPPA